MVKSFYLIWVFILLFGFSVVGQKKISGVVYVDINNDGFYNNGEQTISGVAISNQKEVVLTNDKGEYVIPLRDGNFVYVVKPEGYQVKLDSLHLPKFYYHYHTQGAPEYLNYPGVKASGKAPEKLNFALFPQKEDTTFKVIAIGDPQTPDQETLDYFRDGVNDMFRHHAEFYLVLGDIAYDHLDVYTREKGIVGALGIPGYHIPGNHDVNYRSKHWDNHFETFRKEYGPDYYSFNYADVHFVVLNNINYEGWNEENNKIGGYSGALDEVQLDWLRNDLLLVPEDKLLVINSHIPFMNEECETENIIKLNDILKDRRNVLSLSGHKHTLHTYYNSENNYWKNPGKNEGVVVGATCGSWWSNPKDENGIPVATGQDGSPKGYFIFNFSGSNYTYDFIPLHYKDEFQMRISSPLGRVKQEELASAEIVVNWFIGKAHQRVVVSIDGEEEIELSNYKGKDPFIERTLEIRKTDPKYPPQAIDSFHMWRVPMPGDLKKGTHKIEVTAYGDNERIYKAYKIVEIE